MRGSHHSKERRARPCGQCARRWPFGVFRKIRLGGEQGSLLSRAMTADLGRYSVCLLKNAQSRPVVFGSDARPRSRYASRQRDGSRSQNRLMAILKEVNNFGSRRRHAKLLTSDCSHPRHGRQLLHRPWSAWDGRHLPQGQENQVAAEMFSSFQLISRMAVLSHATALSSSPCKSEIRADEKGQLQTDF